MDYLQANLDGSGSTIFLILVSSSFFSFHIYSKNILRKIAANIITTFQLISAIWICLQKNWYLPHTAACRCNNAIANTWIQTGALFRRSRHIQQRSILFITHFVVIFIADKRTGYGHFEPKTKKYAFNYSTLCSLHIQIDMNLSNAAIFKRFLRKCPFFFHESRFNSLNHIWYESLKTLTATMRKEPLCSRYFYSHLQKEKR